MDAPFARYSTTRASAASDPQVFIGVILLLRVPLSTVVTAGLRGAGASPPAQCPSLRLNRDCRAAQIFRAGGCGAARNAQAARAAAIDASRAELSTDVWVGGARASSCPSFFSPTCSGQF